MLASKIEQSGNQWLSSVINTVWVDAIIKGWNDKSRKHSIKIQKNYDTASWSFIDNEHKIIIGDNIFELSTGVDDDLLVESFLHHELGHVLYTDNDIKGMFLKCDVLGINRGLMNLAEDARIEHLFRSLSAKNFQWSKLTKNIFPTDPVSILFLIIFFEGESPIVDAEILPVLELVEGFYKRMLLARNTSALFPILQEWIDVFGQCGDESNDINESQSNSDLTEEQKFAIRTSKKSGETDDSQFVDILIEITDEMEQDSESIVKGDHDNDIGEQINLPDGVVLADEFSINHSSGFYTDESETLDKVAISRLTGIVGKAMTTKAGYVNSTRPSKRLSLKNYVRGERNKIYRVKEDMVQACKNINLIIDCSGSMDGEPIGSARTIIGVFSNLAKKGLVKGRVVLTKSGKDNEIINLPMSDGVIGKIANVDDGCAEGLKNTFDDNIQLMSNADMNFIITDGHICDGKIDKVKFNRLGVRTFGLYVGSGSDDEQLLKWFDSGVSRDSIDEVIAVMVRNLKLINN